MLRDFNSVFIYGLQDIKSREPEIRQVIVYAKTASSPDKSPRKVAPRRPRKPPSRKLRRSPSGSQGEGPARQGSGGSDRTLAGSVNASAIPRLTRLLGQDQEDDVRIRAVQALGDLGGERAIAPLIRALRDKNPQVRESAVDALCQIGGDNVIQRLRRFLSHADEDFRKIAAEALERLKGTE